MIRPRLLIFLLILGALSASAQEFFGPESADAKEAARAEEAKRNREIPEALVPWIDWVLRDGVEPDTPRAYDDADRRLPLWASRMKLNAGPNGGDFSLNVTAFRESWLGLPGGGRIWPTSVEVAGEEVPVVERNGRPAIRVPIGHSEVNGMFAWPVLPQRIAVPAEIGLLELTVGGTEQPNPSWDADGTLWLQRDASSEPVDEDFLSIKVHSLLEDGIPLWFETRVELIVAGKSREETLGSVLPKGWELASIESQIPAAIDENGLLKAQLRAGRWTIKIRSFQASQTTEIGFAEGAVPAVEDQALAYQAQPEFRQAEVVGLPQIDVAQTQVPQEWRSLPIYRWETATPFQLVERVRGPGEKGSAPLSILRSLWLDDDGKMLTYQDRIEGELTEIRRLDAADGHRLGSVSVAGDPQLITHNPEGGAPGVEVRSPILNAVATGRIEMSNSIPATGWKADANSLGATLQLAPGYRLFALFGADYVRGDWLTAWTLLDLFLLLLFTLAVFRLRGFRGAVLALIAFGLAYHEPGAPRYPWLFLLIPVALLDVVEDDKWRRWIQLLKWGAVAILLLWLTPFAAYQVQGAIFPQLERSASFSGPRAPGELAAGAAYTVMSQASSASVARDSKLGKKQYNFSKDNLKADPKAVIQTGPGVPAWTWRTIQFGFDGPVDASQKINPVLIPPVLSRLLGIVRVVALVLLAALLLSRRKRKSNGGVRPPLGDSKIAKSAVLAGLALVSIPEISMAQFPNESLLNELRERLTETPEGFPGAVEIAVAEMKIEGESASLDLEYHAAARAAAPVPFPLGSMVPRSAVFANDEEATVLRRDGLLWVLLPAEGIHRLTVTGQVRGNTDWEWGFTLKPRRLSVEAPGWTVSGVRPDGTAEDQILFARVQEESGSAASANYENPKTSHAILVERQIELGLVWRVRTTVSRLSPKGRAVALRVPLLEGEKVVSAGRTVTGGAIEIRLGPDEGEVSWEGELSPESELDLKIPQEASWTERWRLIASSVWNVSFSGLAPVFVVAEDQLVPLWQPWPGESATISVSRPEAVEGAAVTIDTAKHTLDPGRRQRSGELEISLRTSLGEDFAIALPPEADVTSLLHEGQSIPIRKEGGAVVVPLRPGPQSIKVEWRLPGDPGGWTRVDAVTLPVESANVTTLIQPSRDRWLILTEGPLRGPAVRFWAVLIFALIAAVVLSKLPHSPMGIFGWILLSIGLTQIPVFASLLVVAWLFVVHWPAAPWKKLKPVTHNIIQAFLILFTLIVLGIFIGVASEGLLGDPEMYVAGNGSTSTYLQWFTARSPTELPQPGYWSISIWWFRLAMLLWALWLAYMLVRWLRNGWKNSADRGHFRRLPKKTPPAKKTTPPESPSTNN